MESLISGHHRGNGLVSANWMSAFWRLFCKILTRKRPGKNILSAIQRCPPFRVSVNWRFYCIIFFYRTLPFLWESKIIFLNVWWDLSSLLYISRKEKYLLKRVFVSVLLLCLKMLMFVLFYINPCVFTSISASWICTCDLVCAFLVKFETFVWCSVDHCDAWEVFKDHRPI